MGVAQVAPDGLRERKRASKAGKVRRGAVLEEEEEEEEVEDAGRSTSSESGFNLSLWQILLLVVAAFLLGRVTVTPAAV